MLTRSCNGLLCTALPACRVGRASAFPLAGEEEEEEEEEEEKEEEEEEKVCWNGRHVTLPPCPRNAGPASTCFIG